MPIMDTEWDAATLRFSALPAAGGVRLLTFSGIFMSQFVQNLDYLPFGELNSSDPGITSHKFTNDERDSETSFDHTWVSGFVLTNPEQKKFRQYSSQLGRWMHPDPAGLAAVDPSNPQSWNRYSYVTDNPLASVDPFGLCGETTQVT